MGFRELKAALEGRLEAPPENVLVVATSNRRHMLSESMAENRDAGLDERGELQLGEALEEKLALSDRFGLLIGFHNFQQPVYLEIVEHYLEKEGFELSAEVREEALRWTVVRASRSGRPGRSALPSASRGRCRSRGAGSCACGPPARRICLQGTGERSLVALRVRR